MNKNSKLFSLVSPESQGIPSQAIAAFQKQLWEKKHPLHSILILRNDQLVAESYAFPYDADTPHRLYSVSKSFVALAVGLLAGEGRLSVSDRVAGHFPEKLPENPDPLLLETTVWDLLTMSPPFSDEEYDSLTGDPVETFFRAQTTHPAGTIFSYNAASPAVLTALVEKLAGQPMLEYMRPRLLEPIGFSSDTWCIKMPQGGSWGASGILCTPRDLARIGLLLLHEGEWEGKQLLPRDFVRAACSRQIDSDGTSTSSELGMGYGYFIWQTRHNGFAFVGMGSQYLVCLPELNMVLITTGDTQAIRGGADALLDSFWNTVYASVVPSPPTGAAEMLPKLAMPLPYDGKTVVFREDIWEREIRMEENPMGILRMRFQRNADGVQWSYENATGTHTLCFGTGTYLEQEFPEDHYYGAQLGRSAQRRYRCLAGGIWSDANTFLARVYMTDWNVGTGKMIFRFEENRVTVWMAAFAEFFLTEYRGFGWGHFLN